MTLQNRQSAPGDTWYSDAKWGMVDGDQRNVKHAGATGMKRGGIGWRQRGVRFAAAGLVTAIAVTCCGDPSRVQVQLDVEGELVATTGQGAEPLRQSIRVAGRFDFMEMPAIGATEATVSRLYREATAAIIVDGERDEVALADDAREVFVARVGTATVPFLPHGFLTREERDLLDIPFDPLLIDALVIDALGPTGVVAVGDKWNVAADIVAGLLAVDTIETGSVEATLESVSDCTARVTLAGVVDGAVDGVPTHVVVDGAATIEAAPDISSDATSLRYRLDGHVSQLTATLRERRQASHVAPGFAVEARVTISRAAAPSLADSTPVAEAEPVTAAAPKSRRPGPGRPDRLWYHDPSGRFDLVHDARWRAVEQGPGMLVLRLVDRGALLAQCSITALPPVAAADRPTIEEVQRDISRSLEGQFERFEEAAADAREDGLAVIRVVSVGSVGELPFHWVHAVLADEAGQRASVAFMMESSLAERFGTADLDLLAGFRLTGGRAGTPREARLPRKTATP